MSTLNELIAVALDSDVQDTPEVKRVKRRSKVKVTGLLWLCLVILVAYEAEHILIGMGLDAAKPVETMSVEAMYDRAQQILTTRFQNGQLLDQPFEDPVLDRWIAVIYEGKGSYTLYYMGASADQTMAGRNLQFSWE
ncbi:MAG TPA: hypothetical protein VLA39_03265 [Marinobacterium sp.]|nr:hypothetical protein [Marinobacterium sp.]